MSKLHGYKATIEGQESLFKQELTRLYNTDLLISNEQKSLNTLLNIVQQIFALLRYKITPTTSYLDAAKALYQGYYHNKKITLYSILASPSALKELPIILSFLKQISLNCANVDINFLLIQWEPLHIIAKKPFYSSNNEPFKELAIKIQTKAQRELRRSINILPLGIEYVGSEITYPLVFKEMYDQVMNVGKEQDHELLQDILWITNFYLRENSLSKLHPNQAIIDLAIRRGIGHTLNELINSNLRAKDQSYSLALVTELHKRLTSCYKISIPTFNISIKQDSNV